jgi:hypothetical protein
MTIEFLSIASGIALSLILGFVPKLKDKFDVLTSEQKQLITLGLSALVGLVVFGLGCVGWAEGLGLPATECSATGIQQLIKMIAQVAGAAIVTYGGTKYIRKS